MRILATFSSSEGLVCRSLLAHITLYLDGLLQVVAIGGISTTNLIKAPIPNTWDGTARSCIFVPSLRAGRSRAGHLTKRGIHIKSPEKEGFKMLPMAAMAKEIASTIRVP